MTTGRYRRDPNPESTIVAKETVRPTLLLDGGPVAGLAVVDWLSIAV